MARKKKTTIPEKETNLPAAEPTIQPITETIEKNYMPYAMSVIISRAIPEIDGFKPSHRKLLYTMYKMGLLGGNRTKSANVVGQTMKLNPHGDASIYETMVRLTRGHAALLHPFVDSKGSFGKQYSSNMRYAASRYTEVRLDAICKELFRGIDKDAVDMIDNYDGTIKEPLLLPTSFPNILVTPNMGIAVGMASKICPFNLGEVCDGAAALLRNPATTAEQLLDIIKGPDFPGGANIIYNREDMKKVYETGSGGIKLRSVYNFNKSDNCIEITEIPYSTSIELILNQITELVKKGTVKEITDVRDEIDLSGFKLTIDVRRGTDPDKLMAKLYKLTPLQDSFDCNFNILINGSPRTMGLPEILTEWISFRIGCVRRELTYDLGKKNEKLHLLLGLGKILLDIDKAIRIVRETKAESDVVPNLMQGFSIDEIQANYIADIKLRHLNREYIMNRIKEIEELQKDIADIEETIADEKKLKKHISAELKEVKEKYSIPRKTGFIESEITALDNEIIQEVENYNVRIVLTKGGYFKKITAQSLRGNDEQKLKDGDTIVVSEDTENVRELLIFSDKSQVYKAKISDFSTCKASELGEYLPAALGFDEGEGVLTMKSLSEYNDSHNFIFIFENGKGVRIPVSAYQTKSNRHKLTGAYSAASPAVAAFYEESPCDIILITNLGRAAVISSSLISLKTTRSSQGVTLLTLKKKQTIQFADISFSEKYPGWKNYRKIKIPASPVAMQELDIEANQIRLDEQ